MGDENERYFVKINLDVPIQFVQGDNFESILDYIVKGIIYRKETRSKCWTVYKIYHLNHIKGKNYCFGEIKRIVYSPSTKSWCWSIVENDKLIKMDRVIFRTRRKATKNLLEEIILKMNFEERGVY